MRDAFSLINSLHLSDDLNRVWYEYVTMIYEDNIPESLLKNTLLYSYIAMNSLLLVTFREVMMQYFDRCGISTQFLTKTKWLPLNLNMNSKLWCHILACQPNLAYIAEDRGFVDAISFFTDSENKGLDRNTIAHDIITSHKKLGYITIVEIRKQSTIILNSLISIYNATQDSD